MADEAGIAPTRRRYSKAQRDQAVRLVRQIREETGERHGAVQRVARQLGFGVETVRKWVKQADVDDGERPGTTTEDNAKVRRLEQEVRELRRANEILRSASAFFAAELDRPQR
jgi:transposase-like protein